MEGNSFLMHFEGAARLELVRSEFLPPGANKPFIVIRGKTSGAFKQYGSFQWTSGVRAVCAVFLRYALSEITPRVDYCLVGSRGSLAASLDYALSKGPSWIGEMFGSTPSGGMYARRIFRVTNPNRKRPGPVALSVNKTVIPSCNIEIYLNNNRVTEHADLLAMLQSIESQWRGNDEPENEGGSGESEDSGKGSSAAS